MDEIITRLIDGLPYTVPAVTIEDSNGDYNVYINARLGYFAQNQAFRHEYNHIRRKHFRSVEPIAVLEREANEEEKKQPR